MAQSNVVTDVGVAAGGLGTAIAAATVQFNKAAIMPNLIQMVAAPSSFLYTLNMIQLMLIMV